MKPLFNMLEFCPNDCDKPEVKAKRIAEAEAKAAEPKSWVLHNGWTINSGTVTPVGIAGWVPPAPKPLQHDVCVCGKRAYLSVTDQTGTKYSCGCGQTWTILGSPQQTFNFGAP